MKPGDLVEVLLRRRGQPIRVGVILGTKNYANETGERTAYFVLVEGREWVLDVEHLRLIDESHT
jgi:hypothetical protein